MIAALYVQRGGVYWDLPDVDPWDEARDARKYAGPWPVVAHPPCSTWCQLAHINMARYGHAVGDDGGCFHSALWSVTRFGGVLEHPAHSFAWQQFNLPRPRRGRWTERGTWRGGPSEWVTEVSQRAYGHRARKATWLYVAGAKPPAVDWSDPEPEATVSYLTNHGGGDLPRLTKKEAKATPIPFRDLLLSIARSCVREVAA